MNDRVSVMDDVLAIELEEQSIKALLKADKKDQEAGLYEVIACCEAEINKAPDHPELLSVLAYAKAELASVLSNPKSLPLLKESKQAADKAIAIKPLLMDGMAEATLGGITYFTPGKPFGFGNKKEAIRIFENALVQKPESMELLYRYGNVLVSARKKDLAKEHYQKALVCADLPAQDQRETLKQARKQAIEAAIAKLN